MYDNYYGNFTRARVAELSERADCFLKEGEDTILHSPRSRRSPIANIMEADTSLGFSLYSVQLNQAVSSASSLKKQERLATILEKAMKSLPH